MKVHDSKAILERLGLVAEVKTAEEDAAAFPKLASDDGGGVYIDRFAGGSGPWELHPDADELLHVSRRARLEVTVLTGDEASIATVNSGCFVVVPRGHWHNVAGRPTVALLAVLPRTEVSYEDPRQR